MVERILDRDKQKSWDCLAGQLGTGAHVVVNKCGKVFHVFLSGLNIETRAQ